MPLTPEPETATIDEAIEDVGSAIREQIEDVVIARPIPTIVISLLAGIIIGRFIL